ncbi:putative CyP450 monooxygenase [Hymenopellis radicata]|nr:putative CyP450 monooxygenase [Hymenopellis radicata]
MDYAYSLVVGLAFVIVVWRISRYGRRMPNPPGPKPSFLVGNLADMPAEKPVAGRPRMVSEICDLVYISVLGQPMVFVGSANRAAELFEKRSANYSSRPRWPMVVELIGLDYSITSMPYGHKWRQHRKLLHDYFSAARIHQYHAVQLNETRNFLRRLLDTPEQFMDHIRLLFAAIIMDVTYGIKVDSVNDPYILAAQSLFDAIATAGTPGAFWVDAIPALKYVPSWFPGAGFQKKAAVWRATSDTFAQRPFDALKAAMATDLEHRAQSTAASMYAGGSDTTMATIQFFFLAMTCYPEVQKKAQLELDQILGGERLPLFSDRTSLPYINALHPTESFAGVPHYTAADDVIDGMLIPKVKSILHDPNVFPEPMEFRPERFSEDGVDPSIVDTAFGFGRRQCPGRHFSDSALFIVVASVLTTFDIRAVGDEKPQPGMTSAAESYPLPFSCTIRPRSKVMEDLVRDAEAA